MRQAGRYLPEYRALRQEAKQFLTLCRTPDLACQVTLQPLERYPLDAAILFSDILILPDVMGLGLDFVTHEGPVFRHPLQDERSIARLPIIDPAIELSYVLDAIRLIKANLKDKTPLIGFAGSPWTVATYMVEGGSSKHFNKIKKLLYADPVQLHQLLRVLAQNTAHYLQAQIEAGVDVVMLFDTWGGVLSHADFLTFSVPYMQSIVTEVKKKYPNVPVILFTKNGGRQLEALVETGADALGLDSGANVHLARQITRHRVALQGNLDPAALYAEPAQIVALVEKTLAEFGPGGGHVFNLGHGIYPDTNPEHVQVLCEAVRNLSPQFHVSQEVVMR
jgi:uroporphyrinogen decarboxylase